MCPPDDIPPVPDPNDLATVRKFNFALKIACDELHDDPFNPVARAELVRLIKDEAPTADAAKLRVATSMWSVAVRERERSL
ncbi:MAG: hypothetical protein QOF66_163 [Mycobacterium sp.]|jgi:hypothetical protein|uniref:hypothetical protein n=1 Tax=Mycobacterium sp. TaxID=1785 RepID=UPI0028B593B5|nr:hypothetical protein [Mycobacterium sp.]MDT5365740.1 hypothetical protein [Mycobacterium sp.]